MRYYEEIGLLPEPARSTAGYRLYGASDRERLHFIIKAKQVGFTLEEIADIFALQDHGKQPCGHVVELLDEKLHATDEQLRALLDYRDRLHHVRTAAASRARESACVCGIIECDDAADISNVAPPPQPLANKTPARTTR
ncbi:MAG: MerR family DNA-binding protein [Gemmatimonadaceae bacterium]